MRNTGGRSRFGSMEEMIITLTLGTLHVKKSEGKSVVSSTARKELGFVPHAR